MSEQAVELESALAEWRAVLGERWVDAKPETRSKLEAATLPTSGRVLANLVPATVEELSACLRIARRHALPVHVFSRGRNHGYGPCGPGKGCAVAIELSRLDGISEFDDELGVVRVQAGVTVGQLAQYLQQHGASRMLPATGAPLAASLLASVVERGLGFGADGFAHSCRYEIVTAAGESFETGFGRLEGSRVANLMRSGVGPSLDGIFTQSSLGVITAATFWLPRRPRFHTTFLVATPARDRVGALFDCMAEAARSAIVRDGASFALGGFKLAALLLRREDFADPDTPLFWSDLERFNVRWGRAAWLLSATVDADTRPLLRAKERALRAVLKPRLVSGERYLRLTPLRVHLARMLERVLPRPLAKALRSIVDIFFQPAPLLGHPSLPSHDTAYWALPRRKGTAPCDLHADGVGLIELSIPVPLCSSEIREVCSIIDDGLLEFGFEPATQVTLISERLARVNTTLCYDRTREGQDARALECQSTVYDRLRRRGYYADRLQPHLTDEYASYGRTHQATVGRLERALDPERSFDASRHRAAARGLEAHESKRSASA